ncbi:hypothetical protein DL765_010530 [Monosporascus sp. GIB2]|nr:hypothetical protein DL765_010530 [Monosporascus sp. GIB2]
MPGPNVGDFDWDVGQATDRNIEDVQLQDVDGIGPSALHKRARRHYTSQAAFGNENVINYLRVQGISIGTIDTASPV